MSDFLKPVGRPQIRLLAGKTAVVLITTLLLQLLLCALAIQSAPGCPVPVNYTNSPSISMSYILMMRQ